MLTSLVILVGDVFTCLCVGSCLGRHLHAVSSFGRGVPVGHTSVALDGLSSQGGFFGSGLHLGASPGWFSSEPN